MIQSEPSPRKRALMKFFGWAALYVVVAVVAIGANPLRGETVGPFDLLASAPGWNPDGAPVQVRHSERSDIVDALLPAWLEARRQLRHGSVPLWNPLPAGGTPALLDPVSVELTPGFALFALMPDPAFGFYLSVLSCLVIAGLGMHLLVARYYAWPAALFAGCSYMLCGFLTAWLFWPHTHTAIWIPWLLLAVDSLVVRDSVRAYAGVAVATAVMVLGGFPFVAAIGLGAAFVHAVSLAAVRGSSFVLRKPAGVLLAVVLGLMLCAVPLLTLVSGLGDADLSYRRGGSSLSLADARALLGPWLIDAPRVETNMYVGIVALLLAIAGLVSLVRNRRNAFGWSGLVFLLTAAILVFGILPESIGTRLPVLSNNPWSRAILLLDIGIIVLAATGLDWLINRRGGRRVLLTAALVVCGVQTADLMVQFRRFNGATPSRYFYAESPALTYVKARIGPFQRVAVDNGAYLVSGTTGGAGLADWYAHALRSTTLHRLLGDMAEDPFTTPTATAMNISRYRWRDDLLDVAALCYALYPNSMEILPVAMEAKGGARQALPPINRIRVVQNLRLDKAVDLSTIALRLATYRAMDLDGKATLSLFTAGGTRPVATAMVPGSLIRDNQMVRFRFDRVHRLTPGDYRIELFYMPGPASRNLTAWVYKDSPGQVLRDTAPVPGSLDYVLYEAPDNSLLPVFQDKAVTAAVNPECAKGPYWTRDLTNPKATMSQDAVALTHYKPSNFSLQVTTGEKGYVIIPMRLLPGWQARVDGRPAALIAFNGIMPALEVPAGASRIELEYRPPAWRQGLAAMLLAAIVLGWLWATGMCTRPAKLPHV